MDRKVFHYGKGINWVGPVFLWVWGLAWGAGWISAGLRGPIPITDEDSNVPFTYWPAWTGFAMGALGVGAVVAGVCIALYLLRERLVIENGELDYQDWRGKNRVRCRLSEVTKIDPSRAYPVDQENPRSYQVFTRQGSFKFNQTIVGGQELFETLMAAARRNAA